VGYLPANPLVVKGCWAPNSLVYPVFVSRSCGGFFVCLGVLSWVCLVRGGFLFCGVSTIFVGSSFFGCFFIGWGCGLFGGVRWGQWVFVEVGFCGGEITCAPGGGGEALVCVSTN